MEGTLQLIQISTADLSSLMEAAVTRALSKAGKDDPDEQVDTTEAMEITGYATHEHFRLFCKHNGIEPIATRRRKNFYLKHELLKATRKKYLRR